MGTCAFSLTAPSHIPVIKALPHAGNFLLPARFDCDGESWAPWLTPPAASLFPSPHGATREWPRGHGGKTRVWKTPSSFLPSTLKGANAKQAPSSAEWKDNTTQGTRGNMKAYVCVYAYKWRLFTRKTDNQTSVMVRRTTYLCVALPIYLL